MVHVCDSFWWTGRILNVSQIGSSYIRWLLRHIDLTNIPNDHELIYCQIQYPIQLILLNNIYYVK